LTCMMTLNFLTQIQKVLRSCEVVALAFMCPTRDSTRHWWTLLFWVVSFQISGSNSLSQHVLYLVRLCCGWFALWLLTNTFRVIKNLLFFRNGNMFPVLISMPNWIQLRRWRWRWRAIME
jgi:hypothetical protein